jgi:hypothetical protein
MVYEPGGVLASSPTELPSTPLPESLPPPLPPLPPSASLLLLFDVVPVELHAAKTTAHPSARREVRIAPPPSNWRSLDSGLVARTS